MHIIARCLIWAAALALAGSVLGQSWTWQSPQPQGNYLNDVEIFANGTGWAVGTCGAILHTTDGGQNWSAEQIDSGLDFSAVDFANSSCGWACGTERRPSGSRAGIMCTTDGGASWVVQYERTSANMKDVFFVNEQLGFVLAQDYDISGSVVLRTTDGGATWVAYFADSTGSLECLAFASETVGWAIGLKVVRTTDGGLTWQRTTYEYLYGWDAHFFNEQNGLVMGFRHLYSTVDGGSSWSQWTIPREDNQYALSMDFPSSEEGWIVGSNGLALNTTDGGGTWQPRTIPISVSFSGVSFTNGQTGWAAGQGGRIFHTDNGGLSWTLQAGVRISERILYGVDFADSVSGWICGNRVILRTTDAGVSWIHCREDSTLGYADIESIAPNEAWAALSRDSLIHTTDGGTTWDARFVGVHTIERLQFVSPDTGFVLSHSGIARTVNGGQTWEYTEVELPGWNAFGMCFVDGNRGWIGGGKPGFILHTTDGGLSWTTQYFDSTWGETIIEDLSFSDSQNGWGVGWYNTVFHTTDGGQTWIEEDVGSSSSHTRVCFTDVDHGWVVSENAGRTFYTTDGGETWNVTAAAVDGGLFDACFPDARHGWAVGREGVIVRWENTTTPVNPRPESALPLSCSLAAYPNPFNPRTNVVFEIPLTGRIQLRVFDVTGRLVQTIADHVIPAGSHTQVFDGSHLPSGIYFVQLRGTDFGVTKKLVLLK
ncbi:T9SS type A sorting domain-containing protein [bacterium]|nr:T9SS type A sorting domain-containing protein [bacterium]MBU1983949.1 T9SS type A sorting domain-containing protein [bacterium]